MICPRCNQDELVVSAVPSESLVGVSCPECDAYWIAGWLIGKYGHEGQNELLLRYGHKHDDYVDYPETPIGPDLVEPDISSCTLPTADQVDAPDKCPRCEQPSLVFATVPISVIAGVRCTECDAFWRAFTPIKVPGCREFTRLLEIYRVSIDAVVDVPVGG